MKFNLLIKKFLVCILSCVMAFAAFIPAAFASFEHNEPPLCVAARDGDLVEVMRLVAEGVDVNCRDNFGETPLYFAVRSGNLEVVRYLVEVGHVDVNCKDYCGYTPLHLAAWEGWTEFVIYLVEEGHADVNCRNKGGNLPLNLAAYNNHTNIVRFLKQHGAKEDRCLIM